MSKASYTPGPWQWDNGRPPKYERFKHKGYPTTADRHLIAAAPALLEACKAALEIVGCYTLGSQDALDKKPTEAKLEAAIAQAEGR
jgi:hypothetical protein